jgi:urease accessory protein
MSTTIMTISAMSMGTAMLHRPAFEKFSETISSAALYRLMAWFSPAFPVGAYSYSSGIEWAVEAGDITNTKTLQRWLRVMLGMGSGFCDAVFVAQSHRAISDRNNDLLREVIELAAAMAPSKERFLETTAQGEAFLSTMRASWPCSALDRLAKSFTGPLAYPVAVGVACAGHGIPVEAAVHAYLQALMANLVSAGVRLIPLGQTDGQRLIAALEYDIAATSERALTTKLDDIGSSAFRVDAASMHHETQYTRLFRS